MIVSRALWTVASGKMEIREETSIANYGDHVFLLGLFSGVSRGTERLVLRGEAPESEYDRMRCPFQEGDFPFPVKYGYAYVGAVDNQGAPNHGQLCFALAPHQDRARLPADAILPLPPGLPPKRATLAANMETALNIVWDSHISPGDRVLITGAGVVGLLTAWLAARTPGTSVWVADVNAGRREIVERIGAAFVGPPAGPEDVDVAINASASAAGLNYALAKAGLEARVVEASWHGTATVPLALGEAFHSRRLALVSSQVGRLPAHKAARWSHRRRLAKALDLLVDAPELDALLTHEIVFEDAPERLPGLIDQDADVLSVAIRYDLDHGELT